MRPSDIVYDILGRTKSEMHAGDRGDLGDSPTAARVSDGRLSGDLGDETMMPAGSCRPESPKDRPPQTQQRRGKSPKSPESPTSIPKTKTDTRSGPDAKTRKRVRDALDAVVTELVDECVAWYRDDSEDLAGMAHDELKTVVLDYLARQSWYEAGVTAAPEPRQPIQLTGTHRHHWMVDGEAVYFPEPVTEEEARGRWTTKQPRTAHQ